MYWLRRSFISRLPHALRSLEHKFDGVHILWLHLTRWDAHPCHVFQLEENIDERERVDQARRDERRRLVYLNSRPANHFLKDVIYYLPRLFGHKHSPSRLKFTDSTPGARPRVFLW